VKSVRFCINLCLLPARLSWSCTKSSMKYFVYLPVMFMLKRYEPELEQKISNRKKKIKKLTSDIATPLLCSLRTLILRLVISLIIYSCAMSFNSVVYALIYFQVIPMQEQASIIDF